MVLDQLQGMEGVAILPGSGICQVVQDSSWHPCPNLMWHPSDWMKWWVKNLTDEEIPWWQLVTLMMGGGVEQAKGLAKHHLLA